MNRANRGSLPALVFLFALLALWQLGAMKVDAAYILPTPVQILGRLWELRGPLFTVHLPATMAVTGLGLAMVLKVTEAHGGSVRITSETEGPERGATVRFLLPATPEAVEELARREKDSSSSAVPDAVPASADVSNSSQE